MAHSEMIQVSDWGLLWTGIGVVVTLVSSLSAGAFAVYKAIVRANTRAVAVEQNTINELLAAHARQLANHADRIGSLERHMATREDVAALDNRQREDTHRLEGKLDSLRGDIVDQLREFENRLFQLVSRITGTKGQGDGH